MRKQWFLCMVLSLVCIFAGCKAVNAPAPLPIGAKDAIDANANEVLQAAHAFAAEISTDIQTTDPARHIELTSTQKKVFETLNRSINLAAVAEQSYHQAPSDAGAVKLQASTNDVQTKLTAAQSALQPAKGK